MGLPRADNQQEHLCKTAKRQPPQHRLRPSTLVSQRDSVMEAARTNKLKRTIASWVRGPGFLSGLSLMLLLAAIPAQGTLLRGYINAEGDTADKSGGKEYVPTGNATDNTAGSQASTDSLDEIERQASVEPTNFMTAKSGPLDSVAHARSLATILRPQKSTLKQALLAADSFPRSFAGAWHCVTVVIDSAVRSVQTGERINSQVSFVHTDDGRVVARWEQPGWTEASASVIPLNEREASMDRTNYFIAQGAPGSWSTHSEDHYVQLDANRITATSFVDQYIDGQFLGRYRTRSVLYRATGNMAFAGR